jgi:hypothetical protein
MVTRVKDTPQTLALATAAAARHGVIPGRMINEGAWDRLSH